MEIGHPINGLPTFHIRNLYYNSPTLLHYIEYFDSLGISCIQRMNAPYIHAMWVRYTVPNYSKFHSRTGHTLSMVWFLLVFNVNCKTCYRAKESKSIAIPAYNTV